MTEHSQSDAERPLCGLVLAGGRSRRFGSDKAAYVVDGERLVDRAVRRLGECADPVLVAPGAVGRLGPLAAIEVADSMADAGPLAGLLAGLHASPHRHIAVIAVDLVSFDPRLLTWLAARLRDAPSPVDAALPVDDEGRLQPLHAVYSTTAIPAVEATLLAGEHRVLAVVDRLRTLTCPPPPWVAPGWSDNLNTPPP